MPRAARQLDGTGTLGYNWPMAQELLFQTNCGASGDMILAAMIDLLDVADEFKRTFENIGLPVTVTVGAVEKNHLRCRQVTISRPGNRPPDDSFRHRRLHCRHPFLRPDQGQCRPYFQQDIPSRGRRPW